MYSFQRTDRRRSALLAAVLALSTGCSDASSPISRSIAPSGVAHADLTTTTASVVVLLDSTTVAPTHTSLFHGYALNALGDTLRGKTATFSSSNPAVVLVTPGHATGVVLGTANVRITIEGVTGSAPLSVANPTPPATHLAVITQPGGVVTGVNLAPQPVVQVRDARDSVVKSSAVPVTVALAATGGTLVGTTTVSAVNGVASFTDLRVNGIGTYTLMFTSPPLTQAASNAFAITPVPLPPASLAIQTQPAGATTGSAMTTQPVVQILDANGAVITTSVVPVTVARTTGTGVLTGTTTVNAVGGIATFTDLRLDGSGNNVLTFSIATPSLSVSSAGINVAVGPPAQLVLTTQPGPGTSGVALPLQPVVELRDVANQLSVSTIAVTAAVASGIGVLSGPTTVNAVNGVATFASLSVIGPGNSSLIFTTAAPPLTVTSSVFTVAPAGAAIVASLSRDGGSAAGGAIVTVTGDGFAPGDIVQFAGRNATSTVFVNTTTLQATVPAGVATNPNSPTAVDVSVIHYGLSSTLASAFTYWPAPTSTLANWGFEDGTVGPFSPVSVGTGKVLATIAHTGTHSARTFLTGPGQLGGLKWSHAQSDIVNGPGRWHRFYMLMPAATLTATATRGQIKFFMSRVGSEPKGFVMLGEGAEFNSSNNQFASRIDEQILHIQTGPVITADVWHEVQVYEYRDASAHVGYAKIWFDGKLQGVASSGLLGSDDPTAIRWFQFGLAYTQDALVMYPLEVYVDDVTVANGYIDPPL